MYKLEKIEQEKPSRVYKGRSILGNFLGARTPAGLQSKDICEISKGEEIVVSQGVFDYIKTSPIQEIMLKTDEECIFKTTTSTYRLTLVKEKSVQHDS